MTTKEIVDVATKMCVLMEGLQIGDANDVMFILNKKFEDYKKTSIFSLKYSYIVGIEDPYKKS